MRNDPIFTKYKRVGAKSFSKIVAIEGHFGDHGLEISERDRTTLTEHVNVVFHAGSTIRFDERLDVPMKSIFIGTKSMLSLANDMQQLNSFVYVSTAYCNSQSFMPEERIYDMNTDGDSILSLYDIAFYNSNGRPNTYCFTKALTEHYIKKEYRHLPVAIARPSVVAASISEPVPGYCNSPAAISFGFIWQGMSCENDVTLNAELASLQLVGSEGVLL